MSWSANLVEPCTTHLGYHHHQAHVPLLDPDVLICSVGTEIYWQAAHTEDAAWSGMLE